MRGAHWSMVEIDEFDLTVTEPGKVRGLATGARRRRPSEVAWTWVGAALALVLVAVLVAPRPAPTQAFGVLDGDPRLPPTQMWATVLPSVLADDALLRDGHRLFTGSLQVTTDEPRVLVGTGGVGVVGFDAASGWLLWEHELNGSLCRVTAKIVCVHGAGKWRATISVIEPLTGALTTHALPGALQAVSLELPRTGESTVADPVVGVLGADGAGPWLTLLDASGQALWRRSLPGTLGSVWLLGAGDHLYLGGSTPSVVAAATGVVETNPSQVLRGPEGTVALVGPSGESSLVLPSGEVVAASELAVLDEGRASVGEAIALPGSAGAVEVLTAGSTSAAIDIRTAEVLWTVPGLVGAPTVLDGDLFAVVDGVLVRWGW